MNGQIYINSVCVCLFVNTCVSMCSIDGIATHKTKGKEASH